MLWSCGGEVGDGVLAHYDMSRPVQPTVYGEQLPYLRLIVEQSFAQQHLLFARLVVMTDNVLVPHRDFLEFIDRPAPDRAAHRLHVPLATNEHCLFMEDNIIYRMPFGEVWSLDVTRMHSAAVLSNIKRAHLLLDFADVEAAKLLRFQPDTTVGVPERYRVERPPLSAQEHEAMLALAGVIDLENLTQVFGIVIRKNYRRDGGENYAWKTMIEIGKLSGRAEVRSRISELYQHCMLERDE
jgi:hypothetical protein